jgi:hypothetical protein
MKLHECCKKPAAGVTYVYDDEDAVQGDENEGQHHYYTHSHQQRHSSASRISYEPGDSATAANVATRVSSDSDDDEEIRSFMQQRLSVVAQEEHAGELASTPESTSHAPARTLPQTLLVLPVVHSIGPSGEA